MTHTSPVSLQLARIGEAFVAAHGDALPMCEDEPDWPSDCVVGPAPGGRFWRPRPMSPPLDLSGLERALECPLHADFCAYFGSFWSAALPARYEDNDLELLQLWNQQDVDNLVANQIGQALQKRHVRQPLSLFFALVDDRRFLTLDNEGGEVLLETVGQRKPLTVCASLAEFLQRTHARAG